jgi:hypothetical protein
VSLLLGGNPIVSLPASFLSNFPKLRVLDLRNGKFNSLFEELGDLKDLVCLDLSCCYNLEILPDAVRKLHVLKCLILDQYHMLKYLPSGLVGLTSLQVLDTTYCDSLTWAEHTLSGMARAETLGHVYQTVGVHWKTYVGWLFSQNLEFLEKKIQGWSCLTIYLHLQSLSFYGYA